MKAYIRLWGNEYFLDSVNWDNKKEINLIGFHDENEEYHTVFNNVLDEETLKENRYDGDLKYADFKERIFWTKK